MEVGEGERRKGGRREEEERRERVGGLSIISTRFSILWIFFFDFFFFFFFFFFFDFFFFFFFFFFGGFMVDHSTRLFPPPFLSVYHICFVFFFENSEEKTKQNKRSKQNIKCQKQQFSSENFIENFCFCFPSLKKQQEMTTEKDSSKRRGRKNNPECSPFYIDFKCFFAYKNDPGKKSQKFE